MQVNFSHYQLCNDNCCKAIIILISKCQGQNFINLESTCQDHLTTSLTI